jgi:hypothetical protein
VTYVEIEAEWILACAEARIRIEQLYQIAEEHRPRAE